MKGLAAEATITQDVRSALLKARAVTSDRDLILITGSLYLIGEARAAIDEMF
jgi:folylpolyglutamate synthase/dihydropteroate synthase